MFSNSTRQSKNLGKVVKTIWLIKSSNMMSTYELYDVFKTMIVKRYFYEICNGCKKPNFQDFLQEVSLRFRVSEPQSDSGESVPYYRQVNTVPMSVKVNSM